VYEWELGGIREQQSRKERSIGAVVVVMVMFVVGSGRHICVSVVVIVRVSVVMVVAVVVIMVVFMVVFVVMAVTVAVVVVMVVSSLVVLLGREHMGVWREHAVASSGLEVRPALEGAQWRGNGALL
jgi:hypothetical protein